MARLVTLILVLSALAVAASAGSLGNGGVQRRVLVKKVVKRPKPKRGPIIPICRQIPSSPPYQTVTCSVWSTLPFPVCAFLKCNPLPPRACKPGENSSENMCSWNVAKNCTSPSPISPMTAWTFGYTKADELPIQVIPFRMGWRSLPKGTYTC